MLIFLSVLSKLVYPVDVAAVGIMGNACILGAQLKDVRDELKEEMKEMNRSLTARLTTMEQRQMSFAETLLRGCRKR